MKKIKKYVVYILLFLSFTMIVIGCFEDLGGSSSGPCPQNRTCYAKWVDPYTYRARSCGGSTNCIVTKAAEKQLTVSCDCK